VNIILKDTAEVNQNLHEYAKSYDLTLITFFDPSCEHCKVELPRMDSTIKLFNQELVSLNKNISTIKKEKIIVKKIYDEKINRVDGLNDAQLDSFFTNRYK
jgi:protein-disulfide isomerase